jgi:hypothetical protein
MCSRNPLHSRLLFTLPKVITRRSNARDKGDAASAHLAPGKARGSMPPLLQLVGDRWLLIDGYSRHPRHRKVHRLI